MAYKILTTGDAIISLDQLKKHAYVQGNEEDDLLSLYIDAACERFGLMTGFVIPETEFLLTASSFNGLKIYRGPIIEIQEVKYTDAQGQEQTIDPELVHFSDERPSTIVCKTGWPTTSGMPGSVRIKFKAGHGEDEILPKLVKWAILTMAATYYENREEVVTGITVSSIPNSAQMVIDSYSIVEA